MVPYFKIAWNNFSSLTKTQNYFISILIILKLRTLQKREKYFREKSLLDTDKTIENESGIEEIEIEDEKLKKTEDFMKKNQKKIITTNGDKISSPSSNSTSSSSESEMSEKSEDFDSRPEDKTAEETVQIEETEVKIVEETLESSPSKMEEDKVEDMNVDETLTSEHS